MEYTWQRPLADHRCTTSPTSRARFGFPCPHCRHAGARRSAVDQRQPRRRARPPRDRARALRLSLVPGARHGSERATQLAIVPHLLVAQPFRAADPRRSRIECANESNLHRGDDGASDGNGLGAGRQTQDASPRGDAGNRRLRLLLVRGASRCCASRRATSSTSTRS